MKYEMETMWDAMKGAHYQRTIQELQVCLRAAPDLQAALTVSLEKVVRAAHAEAGTFWFYNQFDDGRIRPQAVCGGADMGNFSLAPGEGISGHVIGSGNAILIGDCRSDARWDKNADRKTGFCTRSMICVPMKAQKVTFGCLQIINKTDGMDFDEKDLAFVENLSAQTGLLFVQQHLLDEYLAKNLQDTAAALRKIEPSFSKIFAQDSFPAVQAALRETACLAPLGGTAQKHILRLSHEIWLILQKNRPRH